MLLYVVVDDYVVVVVAAAAAAAVVYWRARWEIYVINPAFLPQANTPLSVISKNTKNDETS